MNTSHTLLKKAMTNSDHRTYKNTAYIRINMLYFYILYKRGHYYIIETLYSHFSWAMTVVITTTIARGPVLICLYWCFFTPIYVMFFFVSVPHLMSMCYHCFLYSVGLIPSIFLKALAKYPASSIPTVSDMCSIL